VVVAGEEAITLGGVKAYICADCGTGAKGGNARRAIEAVTRNVSGDQAAIQLFAESYIVTLRFFFAHGW
jgi:hypothetical protein